MEISPFNFGTTVSSQSFTNRQEEILRLKQNFLSGVNTILISPRRWGKSSLVERVCNDINISHPALKIVKLDFFTISNRAQLFEELARGVLKASQKKWEDWWKLAGELLKRLMPKLELSPDPSQSVSLTLDWKEIENYPGDILDLPEKLAKKLGVSFLICIDEFQNISHLNDSEPLEKLLRSHWQKHKHVTYCLYGSKRHMMSEIFNKSSRAFYKFGDLIWLQKIKREEWIPFIVTGFEGAGKKISPDLAGMIPDTMQNHPWYVQQLAHYTFYKTRKKVEPQMLQEALLELIASNAPFYEKQVEILSATQINLLRAIAIGETQLTATATMQKYHLGTPRNVQKNKESLVKQDLIDNSAGSFEFLDPGFSIWFRQRFLDTAIGLG